MNAVVRTVRYLFAAWLPLVLLGLTACGGSASAVPQPPTIHYGEDVCELCNMIISNETYAAGYITHDHQQHIFDDIGDMFQAYLQHHSEGLAASFVHNYADKAWIRAETAHYVRSDRLTTPMMSGLAACATADQAKALAAETGGEVLAFKDLLAYYRENPTMGHNSGQHAQPMSSSHQQ